MRKNLQSRPGPNVYRRPFIRRIRRHYTTPRVGQVGAIVKNLKELGMALEGHEVPVGGIAVPPGVAWI